MRNCEDVFGYIESKQDILGKASGVFKFIFDGLSVKEKYTHFLLITLLAY